MSKVITFSPFKNVDYWDSKPSKELVKSILRSSCYLVKLWIVIGYANNTNIV